MSAKNRIAPSIAYDEYTEVRRLRRNKAHMRRALEKLRAQPFVGTPHVLSAFVDYRIIDGWPGYGVGSDGHVYSFKWRRGPFRQLAENRDRDGYPTVQVTKNGKSHVLSVHRTVCAAFHGPKPVGCEVRHLDGSRTNSVPHNLCWGTALENAADREKHGRTARGERGKARLSEVQAREILAKIADGYTHRSLALEYNVCAATVGHLATGRNWSHLHVS